MVLRPAPTDLPVEDVVGELTRALATTHTAVLVAPPGAGKTTLVPLRLLDEAWLAGRKIVMLEPRRLAARAAARRMAALLGEEVGATVGYQTRDERRIGRATRIEVVTEGILTRRLQSDPALEGVGLVIFDEVHERNVPTDLGLAFLLDARRALGTDLAVLAMSATVDVDKFSSLLASNGTSAPVIRSEGRQFPVDVRHLPRRRDDRLEHAVADAVDTALRETEGDILVFLPGIGEIERCRQVVASRRGDAVDVVRLAGALPTDEQDAALRAGARRRVVLSTDIAETSLTVDGVGTVIDAGLARVPRLDVRTGLTALVTVATSRASADQRSGRAGRLGPGVAYRLWSRIEETTRPAHLPAEITQVDLCGVALEIAAWGTPVDALPFLDTPPARALAAARETLAMLHLVDDAGALTAAGRDALALPLHPRLGAMVARNAHDPVTGWIACMVAALLEERDIFRGRPTELPSDLALRARVLAGLDGHDAADRGALQRVLQTARGIARRAGIDEQSPGRDEIDTLCGAVLLSAYPDRLAMRRESAGQFVMRAGGGARLDRDDPVARERFIVLADVDAQRGTSIVRRCAAIDIDLIATVLGDDVDVETRLLWDKSRDDLVLRVVRRVGAIRIDERDLAPSPGDETARELLDRVRTTRCAVLGGVDAAAELQARVAFARRHLGDEWPDLSTKTLVSTLDDWLAPYLAGATGRADLERIDLSMVLSSMLGWDSSSTLERIAPRTWTPPRGRPVVIDYTDPVAPSVSTRVQNVFGVRTHPTVLDGRVALRVHLLSPADRPIQVTSDLPGFWSGSWADVRKDMAGRYPKHEWPVDPNA